MQPNYFVCTLGQASSVDSGPKPYQTISDFLSYQAQHNASLPAIGFPVPHQNQDPWDRIIFTFGDVDRGASIVARRLLSRCGPAIQTPQTIALLAHSSPDFLFVWLALIRLGHAVLLIAPQCQPTAIVHLCKQCQVSILLHDDSHSKRAQDASSLARDETSLQLNVKGLPFEHDENIRHITDQTLGAELHKLPDKQSEASAVAYLHHTSGTSSGLPKPIPQSHKAAISVLPRLPESPTKATFTTTPLYHGGVADLFRAWTSNALIWFFPSRDIPVTARNICKSLDVAKECSQVDGTPSVKYFSSVPYILQMMEADEQGLVYLQKMDIVGVGGAALPAEVGNRIVENQVNLISRFGSAECGFLLSSYRDFQKDKDWQYLRNSNPPKLLAFENRGDGLAELVIKKGWPHMAKTNRPDGSFATADLFAPHLTLKDAWLYHSRADSQLTLITGKKFDPAPLEAAIATSHLLDDVLIFGDGRPYPGALLLRSETAKSVSDADLLREIVPLVKKLNSESQDHARIPQHMLIPLPHQEIGLEKSSKGTIIRRAADQRFKTDIDRAYEDSDASVDEVYVPDEKLSEHLIGLIKTILSSSAPLEPDAELFSLGMDSIASMQLRNRLRTLVPNPEQELPLSIVEDCGSVNRLSEYIVRRRKGADIHVENEEQLMIELAERYSSFPQASTSAETSGNGKTTAGDVVLLTGATGALGAHVLNLLRKSPDVSRIYCLVRGADEHAARERVSKALEQRALEGLTTTSEDKDKVEVLQAQLSDPRLGLAEPTFNRLSEEVTTVIHLAWTVNFRIKLRSFAKDNIAGVKHLLDFALLRPSAPARFLYCSSTAAVTNTKLDENQSIPEKILHDPSSSSPLGYSRSKWVAEQICFQASRSTPLRDRIAVVRVGQLSGDSKTGIWNTMEAWPMMLSTARLTGTLPDQSDQPLDWLPVDIAAQAILEASSISSKTEPTSKSSLAQAQQQDGEGVGDGDGLQVYHVLNEHRHPTWTNMLRWLQKKEDFRIVAPREWIQQLEKHASKGSEHPAFKLLGMWKNAYADENAGDGTKKTPRFDMTGTKTRIPSLRDVGEVDEEYIGKVWEWVKGNVK